jgi:putative hydrolase of the HAD superfamily
MKSRAKISCVFVEIGSVLLTNGWDHHERRRVAAYFQLAWAPMEARRRMAFEIHEEGKLTFEGYLSLVVFYEKRPFTRAQFRAFMLTQSKPYPRMRRMMAEIKARHGVKMVADSNESRS